MRLLMLASAILAAGVLALVASVVAADRALGEDATAAAAADTAHVTASGAGPTAADEATSPTSYAGVKPQNAEELALAHEPYPATLPPVPAGDVVKVRMVLKDMTVEIAPGVTYNVWAFDGSGAPGPIVHARQGQTVEMTLVNGGSIPHSIDFHAARIAPNVAFRDVAPGESFTFRFEASDPGVFMYHCGTRPVLAHIANGMYGAIVVDPQSPLPKADREYVLVASEWYLNGDGIAQPASLDMAKARAMTPDWTTFNGYAAQYVTHPLTADPGDLVRFYVVDAGPSLTTASTSWAPSSTASTRTATWTPRTRRAARRRWTCRPAAAACSRSGSTSRVSTPSFPTPSPTSTWARSGSSRSGTRGGPRRTEDEHTGDCHPPGDSHPSSNMAFASA